ncbi:RICIN domain-containing protein [Actinoplanes sp. NPDC026623]|uniref:RICIN domain-containing protein n=1 Tax=Actinoplanes sp. NPDC026623 TaxID=3155610 RepID=UPI0033F2C7F3
MHSNKRRIAAVATAAVVLVGTWAPAAHARAPWGGAASTRAADTDPAPGWDQFFVRIRSLYGDADQCLDADTNGRGNGTRVQVWDCNQTTQQLWYVHSDSTVESVRNPGMCLDADSDAQGANGARIQLWTCNGSAQQKWIRRAGDLAIYNLAFLNGFGTVMDRDSDVAGNGAQAQLWQKNSMSQQRWQVIAWNDDQQR